jgi:hypothetical protein
VRSHILDREIELVFVPRDFGSSDAKSAVRRIEHIKA